MKILSRQLIMLVLLVSPALSAAQEIPVNEYGLPVVNSVDLYQQRVAQDSSRMLVNLQQFIPGSILDIRYATENNFMKQQLYPVAKAYLRLPAAKALRPVQDELQKQGIGLKIFDAYRPYRITVKMWESYKDPTYVASPKTGSRHNRGCAVDLTLIDLKTGKQLEMPTPYDSFSEKAHHGYTELPENALQNRDLLKAAMEKHGFQPLSSEWWHYDFSGWDQFPVLDIPLSKLP